MSEYTPTTADIRHGYIVTSMRYTPETDDHLLAKRRREVADEFDRWLAKVKADAWDEGNDAGEICAMDAEGPDHVCQRNPYRREATR